MATTPWRQPLKADDPLVWGLSEGLAVGIAPTPGPLGLLRIYAPYLGQPYPRMVNFIAIEPIVGGQRGFSELESRAIVAERCQVRAKTLSVRFSVETLANGAKPMIEAIFDASRPHEVALRCFAAPGSAPMERCILTATMGNYGRLRKLYLKDRVVEAKALWPTLAPDRLGFEPHRSFTAQELVTKGKDVILAAETDEADLCAATYAPRTYHDWVYEGKPARHIWRTKNVAGLVARVNARRTYWMSEAAIPGGLAFENIELDAPFVSGQEFIFAIEPPAAPGKPSLRSPFPEAPA
ncbi:hypothetical protein [Armatimonas sp.]|uniref:hypothetical protein n=1 Tax=Armatimonas sp. TaxID=1872638 RepID=UPI00286AD931|nr:hypothetical protein [Armatimonas sp.]